LPLIKDQVSKNKAKKKKGEKEREKKGNCSKGGGLASSIIQRQSHEGPITLLNLGKSTTLKRKKKGKEKKKRGKEKKRPMRKRYRAPL